MFSNIWYQLFRTVATVTEYDIGYVPLVISTSQSFPHSWFITSFVTKVARRVSLVEQGLLTLPEHLTWRSCWSIFCVMFCRSLCFPLPFSFGHYFVCTSSIYDFDYPFGIFKLLFSERTSSMSRKVKLKDRANFFSYFLKIPCIKSASYE